MTTKFPQNVTVKGIPGISAKIYRQDRSSEGKGVSFILAYALLGKRKLESFSDHTEAITAGQNAIRKIAGGDQVALEFTYRERVEYQRGKESVQPFNMPVDTACRVIAECLNILAGKGSPVEACREFAARHSKQLPKISVADAVRKLKEQVEADGKSQRRKQQVAAALDPFAEALNVDVDTLTPALVASYLTALTLKERTKRNHRDVIGYFGRWLVLRGYLARGTDLLEGVQNYTARKIGEITTYSAEEMSKLIENADTRLLPFIVIAGFAGLRHAEIARLDWANIDMQEGFIEVSAEKSKTDTRRIVPLKDNLKSWLLPLAKRSGKVVPFANITKQLLKLADTAKIEWKHNALRHTYISARVAECADVPRVADEAGNSVQVIRTNYLKRIRPAQATAWFSITPNEENTINLTAKAAAM